LSEEEYSLAKSLKGKYGQIVPCLADADGEVFDGLHRKKIDPNAETIRRENIKTAVDRTFARMIANKVRRQYRAEELSKDIGFLVGSGFTIHDIEEMTGVSERTLYRYMPEHLKKPEPEQLAEAHRKTADIVPTGTTETPSATKPLIQCDCCGMGTHDPKPFGRFQRLCETCYLKAVKYPRLFAREPKTEVKTYKPKETGEFRRARMQPGVSKMESAVLEELHKRGHTVEFQKEVCLEKTVVDFIVDGKPVYLDGKRVHQNREWTDERIRGRLSQILGEPVHAIIYESFNRKTKEEIVEEIEGVV